MRGVYTVTYISRIHVENPLWPARFYPGGGGEFGSRATRHTRTRVISKRNDFREAGRKIGFAKPNRGRPEEAATVSDSFSSNSLTVSVVSRRNGTNHHRRHRRRAIDGPMITETGRLSSVITGVDCRPLGRRNRRGKAVLPAFASFVRGEVVRSAPLTRSPSILCSVSSARFPPCRAVGL